MLTCPKCKHSKTIKNGHIVNKQRYLCKDCGYQFTRTEPRGRPTSEHATALLLYCLGLSMNCIARILSVSTPTVLRWIRSFAENNYKNPAPGHAVIVELDEIRHYLFSKKINFGYGKHIVVRPERSSIGNVAIVIEKPLPSLWKDVSVGK
jgi:transposase-like protein